MILLLVHDKLKTEKVNYIPEINFSQLFQGTWNSLKNPHIWLSGIIGMILYLALSAFAELLWRVLFVSIAGAKR